MFGDNIIYNAQRHVVTLNMKQGLAINSNCHLLITFKNSLDLDQDCWQMVGSEFKPCGQNPSNDSKYSSAKPYFGY